MPKLSFTVALFLSVSTAFADDAKPGTGATFWTTGKALMPAWGLYPNGEEYAGTKPLAAFGAWRRGRLTWVADFPADGVYEVHVRSFREGTLVTIDEGPPVKGGKGRTRNNFYTWEHLGKIAVNKGRHHVDISVAPHPDTRDSFDAILFTAASLDPDRDALPQPDKTPIVRAPRTYRSDAHLVREAGQRGFVVGVVEPYEEMLNDAVPTNERLLSRLDFWGAADQYVNATFAVRALEATGPLAVSLKELAGPRDTVIGAADIDVRVVQVRKRSLNLWEAAIRKMPLPDLLLRDERTGVPPRGKQGGFGGASCTTALPAHESRQFWLTVRVPTGAPSGLYKGTIELTVTDAPARSLTLPVVLDVLALKLRPVEGHYSIFHRSQSVDPTQKKRDGYYVRPERYRAELKDQARHGANAAILFGGPDTLKDAWDAGLTQVPVVGQWPGADAFGAKHVADAKALGFADLYFLGVDEPQGERIEACRKEAQWRLQNGFHMFAAINAKVAYEALKDVVDRPVLSMNVFNGPDNAAVLYARKKGFVPISYWTAGTHYPLWYRALAGLYNTRCGYLGTSPWAYQDFPDERLFEQNKNYIHAVAYPDETGEPIPTLVWEAYRAGVDDVRYLQALDRAIGTALERARQPDPPAGLASALAKAQAARRARFESIAGRLQEYICDLQPDTLDSTRRALADATVSLQGLLR